MASNSLPVETRDHRVVDLQQNAPALLRATQLNRARLHEPLKILAEARQLLRELSRSDLGHDGGRQAAKDLDVLVLPLARLRVHDAEGSEGLPFSRRQGDSRVRDDAQLGHGAIVPDQRVLPRIRESLKTSWVLSSSKTK